MYKNIGITVEEDLLDTLNSEGMCASENIPEEETSFTQEIKEDISEEILSEVKNEDLDDGDAKEENEVVPEDTEDDGVLETENEKQPEFSEEISGKDIESVTLGELYTLCNEFPEEKVASDVISESFKIFASGRKGNTSDIYKDYLRLKKCFENAEESSKARLHSGFDSYGKATSQAHNLTKRQMQIARESGMSFSEYSELLQSIPAKGKRVLS